MCEEKSVIKIFYDNDWGWKLVPEFSTLVLYITVLSGHVKNRRDFPPVFLEIDRLFRQPSLVHNAQFPINLPPVTDRHSPFFVASKVDRYKALSNAVSLGNTLLWRFSFR